MLDTGLDATLVSDVVYVKFKLYDIDKPIHKLFNESSVYLRHKIVVEQLKSLLKYCFQVNSTLRIKISDSVR